MEKVKKRRLALVLPEALLVRATSSSTTTATTDYLFALFASRDAAYTRTPRAGEGPHAGAQTLSWERGGGAQGS